MGQKDYERAIAECKELISKQARFDRTYKKLAEAYAEEKKPDDALDYFRRLLNDNPQNAYTYYGLGSIYREKKEYGQALENFKKSIQLSPQLAGAFANLADTYKDLRKLDEAVKYLNDLLEVDPDNAYVHYGLGCVYNHQMSWQNGLTHLNRALELKPDLVEAMIVKAGIYFYMGRSKEAPPIYQKGLEVTEKRNDLEHKGKILSRIGVVLLDLHEYSKSLEHSQQALKILRSIGERKEAGIALDNMANAYRSLNDYADATQYYELAVKTYQEVGDRAGEAHGLQGLGIMYRNRGNYPKAFDHYQRALKAFRELGNRGSEGAVLNGMGIAYAEIGNYSQALDHYQGALKIFQELKDPRVERITLNNIGNVYRNLGAYSKALEHLKRSLKISQNLNDRRGEGNTLKNIGTVYLVLGNYPKALEHYKKALDIAQKSGGRQEEAEALNNIGDAYEKLRDYTKAMEHYQQALAIGREIGYPQLEGIILNGIGDVYARLSEYQKSVDHHRTALKVGTEIHHAQTVWYAHRGLAQSLEKQNKFDEALDHYKRSIEMIEKVRGQLQETEYKAGFLQRRLEVYEDLISLLFRLRDMDPNKGYDHEAFAYAERAKARAFLDTLAEARANVRKGMSQQHIEQERAIFRDISKIQASLLGKRLAEKEKKRLYDELKAAEDKLEDFKNQLRKTNREYADLRYPEPYDLERVQKEVVDDGSLLVEFMLGEEESFLWLVSPASIQMVALPERQEIEKKVRTYHKLLSEPPKGMESFDEYYKRGHQLFNMLLGPIKNKLGKNKKLIIIPDGVLHYLPFETLITSFVRGSDPRHLLDSHDIAYAPSASVLGSLKALNRREGERLELLAYGDPMFGFKKISAGNGTKRGGQGQNEGLESEPSETVRGLYEGQEINFKPLPHSKREVEAIAGLYPEGLRKVYLGNHATESAVKREKLSRYRRIHFATHSVIDEQVPGRSGLVLSPSVGEEDGILQMNEIFDLELAADLVVLSACQSGLGKLVRGEGMVGLTRAFMYAGAESLVVSLWNVNDKSTAEFMKSFYSHMKSGRSTSEALRHTKREMIKSETPAYAFPYFWAPFVLVGWAR